MPVASRERTGVAVAERLRCRGPEIEEAILARVLAVSGRSERADPQYAHGLRATVSAALEHGFSALECSEDRTPPVPPMLLAQARLAVRGDVSLDTVLRRYFVGYTLLGDFVIAEAEQSGLLRGAELQRLLRGQASLFDRVIASVSEEYSREEQVSSLNPEQRRAERVRRLLAGDLLDAAGLEYDFAGHHLGAIAVGPGAIEMLRNLATELDCGTLFVSRGKARIWAWFGARRKLDPLDLIRLVSTASPVHVSFALGEPGDGLGGWRTTHRQARAALAVAMRNGKSLIRYADVALLSSILEDDLLTTSLRQIYLAPLNSERDGGKALRETLRAYFAAERNVSSAAAALGVSRQTVVNRLRTAEEHFERTLNSCATDIEAALQLEELV